MQAAVAVMMAGGALILIPWLIPVEEGSVLHYVKVAAGVVGFLADNPG
jgi:hypothetical protein